MIDFLYSVTWWGWTLLLIFSFFQLAFFYYTNKKLKEVESFFPNDIHYKKNKILPKDNYSEIICTDKNGESIEVKALNLLIKELNDYTKKNVGTADFAIMQHKTDRYVDTMFENAVSRISFPIYFGLMGTFLGVLVGLSLFNIVDGNELVTDSKISKLINGVLVSMFTSLIGLLLSTISNYHAAKAKNTINHNKNSFYEFLQNELMPELGTSMASSLSKLRSTINKFEPSFNEVIKNFKDTFEQCTNSFGNAFRDNVKVVANAVVIMGENMATINQTVENQVELIQVLKSNAFNATLSKFISTTKEFNDLSNSISLLYKIKEEIIIATQELISTQQQYNSSLAIPQNITEKLNNIFNRISSFEENINGLGESIAKTHMIGNRELNLIEKQLNSIQRKDDLANEYVDLANENLEKLFKTQITTINTLNTKYENAISDHANELENMVDGISQKLQEKWTSFTNMLDNSFDIKNVQTDFEYLKKLQTIDTKLVDIEEAIKEKTEREIYLEKKSKEATQVNNRDTTSIERNQPKELSTDIAVLSTQALSADQLAKIENKINSIHTTVSGMPSSIEAMVRKLQQSIEANRNTKTTPKEEISEESHELKKLLDIERNRVNELKKELSTLKNILEANNSSTAQNTINIEQLELQLTEKDEQISTLQEELQKAHKGFFRSIFSKRK